MAPNAVADGRQETCPDERTRPAVGAMAGRCILVVEDDAHTRELLGMLLDDEGYHAVLVEDGAAALRSLRANPLPCCILLDVWMPTMGGLAFCLVQRDIPELAAIPVIVISAHRRGPWTDAELQVAGYLEKPFPPDQLLALIVQVTHGAGGVCVGGT